MTAYLPRNLNGLDPDRKGVAETIIPMIS